MAIDADKLNYDAMDKLVDAAMTAAVRDYVMPWGAALTARLDAMGVGYDASNPGTPEDTGIACRHPEVEGHVVAYANACGSKEKAFGLLHGIMERAQLQGSTNLRMLVQTFGDEVCRLYEEGRV